MLYTTGEHPGFGKYICINCGKALYLDNHNDTLPPCPACHSTKYHRIG